MDKGFYIDECSTYKAADNLTQIEFTAKQKGILEEETKI